MNLKSLFLTLLLMIPLAAHADQDDISKILDLLAAGDYKQGLLLLKPMAKQGDAEAQYLLGSMHLSGEGVQQDAQAALKWLKQAAAQHHLEAAKTLGKMYASGLGVPLDADEAAKWFNLASDIADAAGKQPEDCE